MLRARRPLRTAPGVEHPGGDDDERGDEYRSRDDLDGPHRGHEDRAAGVGWILPGYLAIRDVTRPVELRVSVQGAIAVPRGNRKVALRAITEINREEVGIIWKAAPEAGGVPTGRITFTSDAQGPRGSGADLIPTSSRNASSPRPSLARRPLALLHRRSAGQRTHR